MTNARGHEGDRPDELTDRWTAGAAGEARPARRGKRGVEGEAWKARRASEATSLQRRASCSGASIPLFNAPAGSAKAR